MAVSASLALSLPPLVLHLPCPIQYCLYLPVLLYSLPLNFTSADDIVHHFNWTSHYITLN
jgi:hypothetical protein